MCGSFCFCFWCLAYSSCWETLKILIIAWKPSRWLSVVFNRSACLWALDSDRLTSSLFVKNCRHSLIEVILFNLCLSLIVCDKKSMGIYFVSLQLTKSRMCSRSTGGANNRVAHSPKGLAAMFMPNKPFICPFFCDPCTFCSLEISMLRNWFYPITWWCRSI